MKQIITKFSLVLLGLMAFSSLNAQTVNMNRYITLTVQQGQWIRIDLLADTSNTQIEVISGTHDTTLIVGNAWTNYRNYFAQTGTMTIYGNIKEFDCRDNGIKITGIDVSQNSLLTTLNCMHNSLNSLNVNNLMQLQGLYCGYNPISSLDISNLMQLRTLHCMYNALSFLDVTNNTQLQYLSCSYNSLSSLNVNNLSQLKELSCGHNNLTALDISNNMDLNTLYLANNPFSTAIIDNIYCCLPNRIYANIWPADTTTDANISTILATNASNATSKNWNVCYGRNALPIQTTGTYICGSTPQPPVNMNKYIEMSVKQNSSLRIDFIADSNNTGVRIVSGVTDTTYAIGTTFNYDSVYNVIPRYIITALDTTIKIYGNITSFYYRANIYDSTLKSINFDNNNQLINLILASPSLSSINLNGFNKLATLSLNNTNVSSLDLSSCCQLKYLYCQKNNLLDLNIDGCNQLQQICCDNNKLFSLDLSSFNQLQSLYCVHNNLSFLNINNCSSLFRLDCYDNNFSTAGLDSIYCSLPDRTNQYASGIIMPIEYDTSINCQVVIATNNNNAIAKNWDVKYYYNSSEIPTIGTYNCNVGIEDVNNDIISAKIYPNPLTNDLTIEANEYIDRLEVLNVLGKKVLTKEVNKNNTTLDFSKMNEGVYIIKLFSAKGERTYKVVKE